MRSIRPRVAAKSTSEPRSRRMIDWLEVHRHHRYRLFRIAKQLLFDDILFANHRSENAKEKLKDEKWKKTNNLLKIISK